MNTIQIKENKQLNIQQKQNYPGLVTSYDTQPGNEVGLFYNGPEHPHGPRQGEFTCVRWQVTMCDPIWQVTARSSEMTCQEELYRLV